MSAHTKNELYFGDCLEVLKEFYKDNKEGFIDLVYIDPPFNSKRDYNILFEEIIGDEKAQKEAFADTWSSITYKDTLQELKEKNLNLFHFLESLDNVGIPKGAVSYLTMMSIRIYYIHKVLKDSGSFYLHCDPTMSHYLKIVCDLIFDVRNFRNEIVWCYKTRHFSKRHFGEKHDIILFYSKSDAYIFNWKSILRPLSDTTIKKFKLKDDIGYYRLCGRGIKGSPIQSAKDVDPKWEIEHPELTVRDYLKEGVPIEDYWYIDIINQASSERLGYPTQKPEELLERIISASSNKGDLVADFFAGCGTTISVAQKMNRRWIGVDISHLAIGLVERKRLIEPYINSENKPVFEVHGFPKDYPSARQLAEQKGGRFEFQHWVVEAKLGGIVNPKKTADGGWDGHLTFDMQGQKKVVLVEVKSGNVNVKNLREFIQVVNKTNSDIGAFVCFDEQVTKPMRLAAKEEGYFMEELFGTRYDKIQIITVSDLLEKRSVNIPLSTQGTFKTAVKVIRKDGSDQKLF